MAGLYSDEEKNADAEAQYLRTIKLAENDTGYYGHNLPQYLAGYAYFLHKLNRDEEAKKTMQRAEDVQAGFRAAVQNQDAENLSPNIPTLKSCGYLLSTSPFAP